MVATPVIAVNESPGGERGNQGRANNDDQCENT